jgi:phenylacetate-coenzyme A ligase PaaK-like adenylate-forming protein
LAEAAGRESYRHDVAVQALDMTLSTIGPGTAEFAMTVRGDIKSLIGVTATVRIAPPGSVERSQGKAQRVVDQRRPL